eukprot:scaffold29452_cov37-Cyclotella_meneghiniana.AAC.1
MSDPTTSSALATLTELSSAYPDLSSAYYSPLSSLYSKKLWHQLTVSALDFLSDPSTLRLDNNNNNNNESSSSNHLTLFQKVLLPIEKKLNSLSLVRMASLVAFSLPQKDGLAVLQPLMMTSDDKDRFGPAAMLYLTSRFHLLQLSALASSNSDEAASASSTLEDIAASITTSRRTLNQLADTESESAIVHSAHYETAMYYYKAVGPPESYYKEAIQYVAYTNLKEDVSDADRYNLAVDLSLAALTGEGVFNFGEIIASPLLLHALRDTECEYLVTLLECGAHGDVIKFQSTVRQYSEAIAMQPTLASRIESTVQEKITLLALVNMVFERPALERTLHFEDIADRTGVSLDQVEWVIMRALSLHLVEGTMDEVEQTVDVTWVMPRVLNGRQMEELAVRFGEWAGKVGKTRDYVGTCRGIVESVNRDRKRKRERW